MPKDPRRHDSGAAFQQISAHFPGMQPPIGPAGYEGQDEFSCQQFGRILPEKIDHRPAQVIRPCRSGTDHEVPVRKTRFVGRCYSDRAPQESCNHHFERAEIRSDWKWRRRQRLQLFQPDFDSTFAQSFRQAIQKITGLTAEGIKKNQNSLWLYECFHICHMGRIYCS